MLCVAPAGSGKTTTLVARVAWLLGTGSDPACICVLTFNRRAAEELGTRLAEVMAPLGLAPDSVRVRTFHGLGREILVDAGVPVEPLLDRAALLTELFGPALRPVDARLLDDTFSRFKLDRGLTEAGASAVLAARWPVEGPSADPAAGRLLMAFVRYEQLLAERGALDFDDLVVRARAVLDRDSTLLARWRERCGDLLIDEVQDLDRSQLRLAFTLSEPGRSIFLVGDDDQTIYAWRLADVRRVLGLAAELPGLRRFDLETNYRCPAPVVQRAVRLIEHNHERFSKHIRPRPDASGHLLLAPDPADDVARARQLSGLWSHPSDGTRAVLARTNADLTPYAAACLERRLPFRAADDGLLLDDPRLDGLLDAATDLLGSSRPCPLLMTLGQLRERQAPEDDRLVASLLGWAVAYPDLDSLRAAIVAARAWRAAAEGSEAAINLATVHGTKGLEFDDVACIGLDEGRFPSARSLAEAAEPGRTLEEERRLAYVAWTRARRRLILVYDPWASSRFIREAFHAAESVAS